MSVVTAGPWILKQANLSLVRKVIRSRGTVTRAEISSETKISSTTVRSLLTEMMENGEIECIGFDESSGGRKAKRYRFRMDRYFGVAFCITERQIHGLLINVYGEILKISKLEAADEQFEQAIISYLDDLLLEKEIKAIGIGVPGVIEGGGYWRQNRDTGELYKADIGDKLANIYKIPVVMENDLNATIIGFGRCYEREFPREAPEDVNMAYLHFEKGCISAGFIAGGHIIRGCHNFAGELGLIPMEDGRILDEYLSDSICDSEYIGFAIKIISWVCGILNPQYVVLGGPDLRVHCIGPIGDGLSSLLSKDMFAEILYSPDMWQDYHDGMAFITAEKMFEEVRFTMQEPLR